MTEQSLVVAVTGPTGTFGFGLLPLLEAEPRVARVLGLARRPFDPARHGWSKMEYRQGDVRDRAALDTALTGADVVIHLAFVVTGNATAETIHGINVEGTLNTFRAAREAGARRFVYASSVAAYGFHPDNPARISEDWPTRPADHLFYAQDKAELEQLLRDEAAGGELPALYLLRPPIVVGPHAVGAKGGLPAPLRAAAEGVLALTRRSPVPVPMPAPDFPLQLIHEDDVGQALLRCALADGPPGAYNIAGDGVITGADVVREAGFTPLPIPEAVVRAVARALAASPKPPGTPPSADWIEALSQPSIMDTTKARTELGWTPRYSALEALRATVGS
jgi:nucleoside-diphosphate-sugar epimerase